MTSLLGALRSGTRGRRRRNNFHATEGLERRVLKTSIDLDGGVLTVVGNDADNRITIRHQTNDPDEIDVFIWDRVGNLLDSEDFDAEDVDRIVVHALGGTDVIRNSTAIDCELHGGEGDDSLFGGVGDDFLFGEAGRDSLFGDGIDVVFSPTGTAIFGDDELYGGIGEDFLYGDYLAPTPNLFSGGADMLYGGGDSDQLTGGGGVDQISGGTGSDLLFEERNADMLLSNSSLRTSVGILAQVDALSSIEEAELIGGDGDNTISAVNYTGTVKLFGEGGDDTLTGGTAADYLSGGDGEDDLFGGKGDDALYGGADFDELYGEADNDRLDGGTDGDALIGGLGADTIITHVRIEFSPLGRLREVIPEDWISPDPDDTIITRFR